jgi:hypothetical protein
MHETYQIYLLAMVMSSYNLPDVYLIHLTKLGNVLSNDTLNRSLDIMGCFSFYYPKFPRVHFCKQILSITERSPLVQGPSWQ